MGLNEANIAIINFSFFLSNFFTSLHNNKSWLSIYPQYRITELFIGIITGYIIFNRQLSKEIEDKLKQFKVAPLICWTLSIGYFWFHLFYWPRHTHFKIAEIAYNLFQLDLWSCSICWIVFACYRLESGGIIRNFLSHPAWQPLSKLNLTVYLLHMPYLNYTEGYYRQNNGFLRLWNIFFGDIIISLILALAVHILIEAPANHIVTLVMKMLEFCQLKKKDIENRLEEKQKLFNHLV